MNHRALGDAGMDKTTELLIVDDNSRDGSVETVKQLQNEGFPIKIFVRENVSLSQAPFITVFIRSFKPRNHLSWFSWHMRRKGAFPVLFSKGSTWLRANTWFAWMAICSTLLKRFRNSWRCCSMHQHHSISTRCQDPFPIQAACLSNTTACTILARCACPPSICIRTIMLAFRMHLAGTWPLT